MDNGADRLIPANFKSFSTQNIPHHERLEYWEAHNADALIGLDIRPLHDQTLEAQQQNRQSDSIRLAKVHGSSQLIERSTEMIRKHPTESVALFLCTQGDSFYTDQNGSQLLQAGQMLACNADSSFVRGFGVGVHEMVLTIRMDEFLSISGGNELKTAQKFTFGPTADNTQPNAAAKRIARWANHTLTSPKKPELLASDEFLSALELLFQSNNNSTPQLYEHAQHLMNLHLDAPDFRRTDLANLLHTSERQIARLFATQNTSFSRELVTKRIQAAEQLLANEPQTPIAEIARRCGFRSTAHFSRTFREMVGHSPTEARAHLQDNRFK